MAKCDALCDIPAMYLQNVLLTISKGALSTRFDLDINLKISADQTSDPYASIGLIVLSNTVNGKLGIIVTPVYKELYKENIPFIALSHNTLTVSLRLPFLLNWIPKYVYLYEIAMLCVIKELNSFGFPITEYHDLSLLYIELKMCMSCNKCVTY